MLAIARVHQDNYGVYGARKVWLALHREGIEVARCTVERLMKVLGLEGAHRGRKPRTTRPDITAARPADLVERNFTAARPDLLWVADFTYVATWAGFVYVAFVLDAFSRRILGWKAATTMHTELVLDALDMAIWTRQRAGIADLSGLVHHNDAGSQGGFEWSSQHLDGGGGRWDDRGVGRRRRRVGRGCRRRDGRRSINDRPGSSSGSALLRGCRARTLRWRAACRRRLERDGFVTLAACHRSASPRPRVGTCRSPSGRRSHC